MKSMEQEKQYELIIHLLISVQSQFHAFRDAFANYMAQDLKLTPQQKEKWLQKIKQSTKEADAATRAQIALFYEGKFGSIDDLIDSLNN